ncbi:hypothetical protein M501DRAFT_985596 [Patellaria atrata CBS 101060]|uniref:C2H2-type domain-containing protein n=1 Tax=Patellaria atrata CBS 101060 TaxID=1346257 RepID=A0A9P4SKF4_9PEZI|nr:hypothetical protein M501DRAFT_985596 [Patellaria atrata CBS 101060]
METGIQTDSKPLITIPARTENNYLSPTFLSAPRSSSKQQDARESPAPVPANAPFRESSINSPAGHILSPRHTLPHTTPPKEKHFFCTHCRDDFLTEVYLKKHEVTFHGNILKWQCPHCQRDFPSLTQLKRHHNKCHHGTTTTSAKDGCNDNCQLPAAGKLSGPKKIAFACGYCVTLFDNFEKYLDHIVHHYQSTVKKTREDWSLTRVIATLLEQPGLHEAWRSFMAKKHGPIESWPSLSWELENSIDGTRLLTDLEMGINENDKTFQTAYELATKSWSQVPVTGLDLSGTISPQTICEAGSSGQGPKDSLIFLEENDILDYYNDYEPPNLDEHPAQGEHPKQSLTQENLNQWYGDNFHNAMNQFHQREEFLELNPPHTLITTQLDKVPHQHATPNFSNPPDIPLPLPPKRSKVDMTF